MELQIVITVAVLCFLMLLPDVPWNHLTLYVPMNILNPIRDMVESTNLGENLWMIIEKLGIAGTAVHVRTCLVVVVTVVLVISQRKKTKTERRKRLPKPESEREKKEDIVKSVKLNDELKGKSQTSLNMQQKVKSHSKVVQEKEVVGAASIAERTKIQKLEKHVHDLTNKSKDAAVRYKTTLDLKEVTIKKMEKRIQDLAKQSEKEKSTLIKEHLRAMKDKEDAMKKLETHVQKLINQSEEEKSTLTEKHVKAMEERAEAIKKLEEQVQGLINQNDEEKSTLRDEYIKAMMEKADVIKKLDGQIQDLTKQNEADKNALTKEHAYAMKERDDVLKEALDKINDLKRDLKEAQTKIDDLRQKRKNLYDEIDDLVEENGKLKKQLKPPKHLIETTLVIPQLSYDDQRVAPLIEQLAGSLKDKRVKVDIQVKESRRITPQDGVMILPCLAVSRVESDINAIFQKIQLNPGVRVVLIVYHHLAPHNSKVQGSTHDRLSDKYPQCVAIFDAVFWEGKMSDCNANDKFFVDLIKLLDN